MLEIFIDSKRIRMGPDAVPYDSYWLGWAAVDVFGWDHQPDAVERVVQRVLAQWADAIERLYRDLVAYSVAEEHKRWHQMNASR